MKAGFAKIDITPPVGIELAGYGYYLKRLAKSVHDPLFARALAFDSEGERLLITSCDLIGFGKELVDQIKSAISGQTGIPVDAIVIHCTHTHTGPATCAMRGCGVMDSDYVRALKANVLQAGLEALANLKEADSIRYAESDSEGIGCNRTDSDVKPIDHTVRSLFIHRTNESPIVLVNYACHPVANGISDGISADYPGRLALALEEQGYDCAFLNGFSGDINPVGERNHDAIEKHGRAIASLVMNSADRAISLSDTTVRFGTRPIHIPLDIPGSEELLNELLHQKSIMESNPGDTFALQEVSWLVDALAIIENPALSDHVESYLQVIGIGDVAFIAFPGETYTAFGLALREKFPGLRLLTVNTANGLVGYIPTADEFDRRGYASHNAARIYNIFTFVKGFGEDVCSQAAVSIAEIFAE
ncbi:MAG TPA: hypothetical protein VGK34_00920 [Armatimonadota bacterium]|jgi:hypothetical protein